MKKVISFLSVVFGTFLAVTPVSARGGAVDYSQSAQALYEMDVFVLLMMGYVTEIIFAIGALITCYSSLVLYQKLSTGEQGFTKGVLVLIGGIIFMIASTYLLPAFFGIRNFNFSFSFI